MTVLERARSLGFLGPPPAADQLAHALAFATAATAAAAAAAERGEAQDGGPRAVLDLGTGGGVPGLVLATAWPDTELVLVESLQRRCRFLEEAVVELGLVGRVVVVRARAEVVGRLPAHRGHYDLVTARAFGPPAVTAECAAPLLAVSGRLLVSEPPGGDLGRWPPERLATLGMRPGSLAATAPAIQVIHQVERCPDRYPRRPGIPAKRPLW